MEKSIFVAVLVHALGHLSGEMIEHCSERAKHHVRHHFCKALDRFRPKAQPSNPDECRGLWHWECNN